MGLAAGLGGLAVGVGVKVGVARLGEAKLGEPVRPPDGCPVAQPVMATKATTTRDTNLRLTSTALTTGSREFLFGLGGACRRHGWIWIESMIACISARSSGNVPAKSPLWITTRTPSTSRLQMCHRWFGPWA